VLAPAVEAASVFSLSPPEQERTANTTIKITTMAAMMIAIRGIRLLWELDGNP